MSTDAQHAALRASVRQLGRLLGDALARHEGPEVLALVEQVRELAREPGGRALHELLAGVDDATAVVLARAFTAYFQLVNVTEQLHRWEEVHAGTSEGPLAATARRIGEALQAGEVDRALVVEVLGRLEYRPVFTAHPTEASSRSVLDLLRKVGDLVHAAEDPRARPADRPVLERRLAELVDLLWQTDELRVSRPEPKDEARTAIYYLQLLAHDIVPGLLEELDRALGTLDVALPPTARPLRFGTWAGGDRDGNPNVTPAVTLDVLGLQHHFGLRTLVDPGRGAARRDVAVDPGHRRRATRCGRASRPTPSRCPSPTAPSRGSTPRSPTGSSSASSGYGCSAPATGWRPAPRTSRAATTGTSASCSPTSPSSATRCWPAATTSPPTAASCG